MSSTADVVARHLVARDARRCRAREDLRALRAAQQRAHERVLAPPSADYQYAHRLDPQSAAMNSSTGMAVRVS